MPYQDPDSPDPEPEAREQIARMPWGTDEADSTFDVTSMVVGPLPDPTETRRGELPPITHDGEEAGPPIRAYGVDGNPITADAIETRADIERAVIDYGAAANAGMIEADETPDDSIRLSVGSNKTFCRKCARTHCTHATYIEATIASVVN